MFGKRIVEYLAFQKVVLVLVAVVGLARLFASLGGLSNGAAAWLSMNAVAWAGAFYYGVVVHTRSFGSYKQILPLGFFQTVLMQAIAVFGILLAIAGFPNVLAAPEFSLGVQSQWLHLLAHLSVGILVPPLLFWGVASLVMLVAKRLARRPVSA